VGCVGGIGHLVGGLTCEEVWGLERRVVVLSR
jgi:hypothetical protein